MLQERHQKLKRRDFGYLCSGSALTAGLAGLSVASADAAQDASLLRTTLTPWGAIRAGNADGSIPAWTGGYTTLPQGFKPGDPIGELFPQEQPILTIDSNNVSQYADRLSEGAVDLINRYGYSIEVFPSHRTHALPQGIIDRIAANVATAGPVPQGWRFGFQGAFGGIPFPILDPDPLIAGPQVVYNANTQFKGYASKVPFQGWSVNSGQLAFAFSATYLQAYPYYQAKSLEEYNGMTFQTNVTYVGPANLVGQALVLYGYTNAALHPQIGWELLNGEGRVRRAPELSFDTPSSQVNDIGNFDELYGFNGSLERYDWKYLGLKEMYVPYNNNKLITTAPQPVHLTHFIDPKVVRYELHRCHAVEATLHPGERNVDARRIIYIDEDTYSVMLTDNWDSGGNLIRTWINLVVARPDIPATMNIGGFIHNLQTGDYASLVASWGPAAPNTYLFAMSEPAELFDPQELAANSQY
jgi:hypothetical protein